MPKPHKAPNSNTRKIQCDQPLVRTFELNRENIDEENRTVELSFSSETEKVERWFGTEVLDHSRAAVRMDRLHAGAPLLFNHQRDQHLGIIETARIEQRRGKSLVRFGRSQLAEEKFQDVRDGILSSVSCSYVPHKMVLQEERDDGPSVYRVTDWEPLEISLVTIPADISVGVGRQSGLLSGQSFDIEIEERTMDPEDLETPKTPAASPKPPAIDLAAERGVALNQGRSEERQRVSDLLSMGQRYASYDGEALARTYIDGEKTVEEFRQAILDQLPAADKAGTRGDAPADLPLTQREVEEDYSLLRAINASVSGDWSKAGFELECSRAIEERAGRDARGFFVPMAVQTRVMNVTTGADLVGTDHLSDQFIDSLRPHSVVMSLGATVLDGLQGNVSIPKKTGNAGFFWLADDADVTDSDPAIGSVALSPKTVAGSVPMSRRLLKQSSPSIEGLVQADLQRGAALAIDLAALEGTGAANQPTGIINVAGVNTQTVTVAGAPTWPELVGFESAVANDDALDGSLAYVTTSAVRGTLKTTAKDAGSGLFLMEGGQANGYGVNVRNGITANRIIFGNWADVLIGMWGILDIMPDTAAKAAAGGLVLRVFQDVDIAVRHAESFCINA